MVLLGDKSIFAIEFEITQNDMGFAKIWFGNRFIGTIEDEIYIKGYLIDGLKQIEKMECLNINLEDKNPEEKFAELYKLLSIDTEENTYKHLISLGTFCDDFTIFSYKQNDEIVILWKLNNTDTPFSDLNSAQKGVNSFSINSSEYSKLLNQYIKELLGYCHISDD